MAIFGYSLAVTLLLLAGHDCLSLLLFIRFLFGSWPKPALESQLTDRDFPTVAVLMGLKGADPDLYDGLRRLCRQNYPHYELFIVVDHETDPAWHVVRQAIADTQATHVHVEAYRPSAKTGPVNSTNSKQMQALHKLDDSVEVVAMADGDLIAHPNWLRDLVTPLIHRENVAATFGNRWFIPEEGRCGSLVRYLWNVGAVISMFLLKMPWGGCFAIKMKVVRELNLIEKWSKQIAFDASTPGDLKKAGLQIRFVPHLLMPNYEECRLSFCLNFFQRQLTWTRLYHHAWPIIAGYAFITGAAWILAIVFAVMAHLLGEHVLAAWVGAALLVNCLVQWLVVLIMQLSIEQVMVDRPKKKWLTVGRSLNLLLLLPVTQVIQFSAVVAAMFCRRVRWRGITLEIKSPTDIRMIPRRATPSSPTLSPRESL